MHEDEVFISYGHPDLPVVKALVEFLRGLKIKVWFDKTNLLPGEQWDDVIQERISKSKVFLLCLSSKAIDRRGFYQKEIQLAMNTALTIPPNQLYLMPVRLDNLDFDHIPWKLRQYHISGLSDLNGINQLITALERTLNRSFKPSPESILRLQAHFQHPLKIFFDSEHGCIERVPVETPSHMTKYHSETPYPALYYRIKLVNTSGEVVRMCRCYVVKIEKKIGDSFSKINFNDSARLTWAFEWDNAPPNLGWDFPSEGFKHLDLFFTYNKHGEQGVFLRVAAPNEKL